jgi:hypothetical protein
VAVVSILTCCEFYIIIAARPASELFHFRTDPPSAASCVCILQVNTKFFGLTYYVPFIDVHAIGFCVLVLPSSKLKIPSWVHMVCVCIAEKVLRKQEIRF